MAFRHALKGAIDLTDFSTLGLSAQLVSRIAGEGYEKPTPIQEKAIPLVLEGRDVMGLAQTGTGKTAAFGLPLIDMLLQNGRKPDPKTVKTLILAPTRELVNQIAENLRIFARKTPLKSCAFSRAAAMSIFLA